MIRRIRKDEDGTALVEFALVLPVLAMLCMGLVDLARVYELQNRLRNAAREGAAFAQFTPTNVDHSCGTPDATQNVVDRALAEDSTLNLPASAVKAYYSPLNSGTQTVYSGCPTGQTFNAGDKVTVKVTKNFTVLTPLISAITGSTITITGVAHVQVQQ
jgi:Flp pilus assembly protein TadG